MQQAGFIHFVIELECKMPYSDILKQRAAQREFIRKKSKQNTLWYKELNKRRKQKRDNVHDIVNHIKRTIGCLLCDEKNPNNLLFHHVIPELKVATIAQLISNRAKLIVVLKEIEKCVCVCMACHKQLDNSIYFVRDILKNEKWYSDWGIHEALEWSHTHPQYTIKKNNFIEILKAIVKKTQIQDISKFRKLVK